MILLCPVTCSAQRKIIIMIIKTPTAFLTEETQAFDFSSGPFLAATFVLGKRLLKGVGPGGWVRNCVTSEIIRRGRSKELSASLCASNGEGLVKGQTGMRFPAIGSNVRFF